jgi:antitoxin component of MazEF toxin-antitoxin module
MEFKIVRMGNSLGVRIPAKVLQVLGAQKDDVLTGELRGSELVLRHQPINFSQDLVDLIRSTTGLNIQDPNDLKQVKTLLEKALVGRAP